MAHPQGHTENGVKADVEMGVPVAAGKVIGDGVLLIREPHAVPRSGLRIVFKELNFHVPSNKVKGERAYLLKNVTAFLEPKQMTALMGPSGSGKTTLLDLLAGRKTTGETDGHLTFGGVTPTPAFLRRYTGYVEQFDTLLGDLTVREMLLYTAELKRPTSESLESKKEKVDTVLVKLALDRCADVIIGDPMSKGISGGQAKRTNIGIALVANPRVLFLDEPTSGLDSFTANEVMKVVAGLKDDGTTIAATIHSPTAATFALFDRVMMLVRGQLVYFGPQGLPALRFAAEHWPTAHEARQLLELHNAAAAGSKAEGDTPPGLDIISAFNDAEILVETVTAADIRKEADLLAEKYNDSQLKKDNNAILEMFLAMDAQNSSNAVVPATGHGMAGFAKTAADKLGMGPGSPPSLSRSASRRMMETIRKELATRSETVTPWWWGLWILFKYRTWKNYRSLEWLGPRVGDKLIVSLIVLTLYLGVGDSTDFEQQINILSCLFMWALLPAFGAMSYVPAIVLERRLFLREMADGLYRSFTYLGAKLLEELFLSIAMTLVFSSYVFYGVQLQGQWVVFWLVDFMVLTIGIALAYFVAAVSPNMDVANAAFPSFVVTLLFFAGQLMTIRTMPKYWLWYSTIDFLRYAWGALMVNQYKGRNIEFIGGMEVLEYYGLNRADKWAYIGYLAIFWFVFASAALLAVAYVRFQKR